MPEQTIQVLSRASAAVVANGDTGALPANQCRALDVEVNVTAINAGTIQFFVDELGLYGIWSQLGQVAAAAGVGAVGTGPGEAINREFGDNVRLRWVLAGGATSVTFSTSITGRPGGSAG